MGKNPEHLFVNGFDDALMKVGWKRRIGFCWEELFVRDAIGNVCHNKIYSS